MCNAVTEDKLLFIVKKNVKYNFNFKCMNLTIFLISLERMIKYMKKSIKFVDFNIWNTKKQKHPNNIMTSNFF